MFLEQGRAGFLKVFWRVFLRGEAVYKGGIMMIKGRKRETKRQRGKRDRE